VYIEKSDCERVSAAMLLVEGGKRRERDEILPQFDFSRGSEAEKGIRPP